MTAEEVAAEETAETAAEEQTISVEEAAEKLGLKKK